MTAPNNFDAETTPSRAVVVSDVLFCVGDRVRHSRSYIESAPPRYRSAREAKRGDVIRISKCNQPVVLWNDCQQAVEFGPACIERVEMNPSDNPAPGECPECGRMEAPPDRDISPQNTELTHPETKP